MGYKYENGKCMVEHHTHYQEIHGYDKTVWMEIGEHHRLHAKLRRIGKCNIAVAHLNKISAKAYYRTEKGQKYKKEYRQNYLKEITFNENMMPNVNLRENISYNLQSGTIKVCVSFQPNHGKKLWNHICKST